MSVARDMGAEVFIVVDVGSGLYKRNELNNALDITEQLANFLFTLNTEPQLTSLGSRDVLIRPELGDIGGNSFDRAAETIPIGESAARAAIESLRKYSLSAEDYARHVAARVHPGADLPVIEFVRTNNRSPLDDAVIASRITAKTGQPLDVAQLEEDIGHVYGLDIFESVRYDVVREEGKTGLADQRDREALGPGVPAVRARFRERSEGRQHAPNRSPVHPYGAQLAQRRMADRSAVRRRTRCVHGAPPAARSSVAVFRQRRDRL